MVIVIDGRAIRATASPAWPKPLLLALGLALLMSPTAGAGESFTKTAFCFPDLEIIPALSPADRQYLGAPDAASFRLSQVTGELLIVEFVNRHCLGCQRSAAALKQAYMDISQDAKLKGKIRFLGIAAANTDEEAAEFRERTGMPFPIVSDSMLELYDETVFAEGTPCILLIRKKAGSALVLVATHRGAIMSSDAIVSATKAALAEDWHVVLATARGSLTPAPSAPPELPVSREALTEKLGDAFEAAGGQRTGWQAIHADGRPIAYKGAIGSGPQTKPLFAVVVSRRPVCDVCHDIHFIYVFDAAGEILSLEPIQLPKAGNRAFGRRDKKRLRQRVVGRSLADGFNFNPKVDAVTKATITSAVVYDALRDGKALMQQLRRAGHVQ